MSGTHARRKAELAEVVAAVMLEARALVLKGLTSHEQGAAFVLEILDCEEIETLRDHIREQLSKLTTN